jgi:hypothetical protein
MAAIGLAALALGARRKQPAIFGSAKSQSAFRNWARLLTSRR